MGGIRDVEWEDCLLAPQPDAALEQSFRERTGRPVGAMRYFVGSRWVADTILEMSVHISARVHLDRDLANLVALVVSQDNSCRYCFGTMRAFLRILGIPEERIAGLEHELLTGEFDARERSALEFARRLSRSDPLLSTADVEPLFEAGMGENEVVELAAVVAMNLLFNRASTLLAIPAEKIEDLPDRWAVRLLRPLLAFKLRSFDRRAVPESLASEEKRGCFAPLVVAFDGLPFARALRRSLDGMWASTALSRRAKALSFAVVARALGCTRCEGEATRLLLEDGLGAAEIESILDHLSSPILDPVEALLVPLARETVWYQPAQIQRRVRAAADALTREQILEFILVVSLANAIARLGFVAALRA